MRDQTEIVGHVNELRQRDCLITRQRDKKVSVANALQAIDRRVVVCLSACQSQTQTYTSICGAPMYSGWGHQSAIFRRQQCFKRSRYLPKGLHINREYLWLKVQSFRIWLRFLTKRSPCICWGLAIIYIQTIVTCIRHVVSLLHKYYTNKFRLHASMYIKMNRSAYVYKQIHCSPTLHGFTRHEFKLTQPVEQIQYCLFI